MRIRRAIMSDAPAIARVQVETWRSAYVGIVPDEHLATLDLVERERVWRMLIADETQITYVAEHNGDGIVGFVNGGRARDDTNHTGELYGIYLLESYQRQGIGHRLVGQFCAWLLSQGHATMYLWVFEDNPYRRFYESLGGTEFRRRTMTVRDCDLGVVAYGWDDISPLATPSP